MHPPREGERSPETGHDEGTGQRAADVTGPHAGYDRYGRIDHYYWRCEACGYESTDAALRERCPRCSEVG